MDNKYLFILSPPFSGSTLLVKLLLTASEVSVNNNNNNREGQFMDEVKDWMRKGSWNENKKMPWVEIKNVWEKHWNLKKPILLEKSPPNILRANAIEKAFQPSYFICVNRNPYAFCEGKLRRDRRLGKNTPPEDAAKFWIKCAKHQMQNVEKLENALFFSYEEFTENPVLIADKIQEFLPEISKLKTDRNFNVRNVLKQAQMPIQNLNEDKIKLLSESEKKDITNELMKYEELMSFFSYELL